MAQLFNDDAAERIAQTVRRVEAWPPERTKAEQQTAQVVPPVLQFVRITSTSQTSGRYPGKLLEYDASAKTWADVSGVDLWVVESTGGSLTTGVRYLAKAWDYAGTPEYLVYVVDNDGGSATGVDGSGTTNYIPRWADSNTLTDSGMYETGVGVFCAAPRFNVPTGSLFSVGNVTGSRLALINGYIQAFGGSDTTYTQLYLPTGASGECNLTIANAGSLINASYSVTASDASNKTGAWATVNGLVFCGGLYISGSLSGVVNGDLSNLTVPTAINTDLISDTDITDDLGSMAIRWDNVFTQTVSTGDTATDVLKLRGRDVDGASWVDFLTITAANTPTCDLASSVTIGGDTIVSLTGSQTLTNKTLTAPTIADFTNANHDHQDADDGGQLDHGLALTGLTDDDHTQYALLAGRSGGQVLIGGTGSGDDITIRSSSHATKGDIIALDTGGNLILGGAATASELRFMEPSGSGTNYSAFKAQAQGANITYTLPASDASGVLTSNGSGSLSWAAAGTGDVTAASNIADNRLVRGDGGAKGVQQSGITCDDSDNLTGVTSITTTTGGVKLTDETGTGAQTLTLRVTENLSANRTLTINTGDGDRTFGINGDITTGGAFATSGGALTLAVTGATNVTLPTTGTLATLAGTETLSNKTLTATGASSCVVNNATTNAADTVFTFGHNTTGTAAAGFGLVLKHTLETTTTADADAMDVTLTRPVATHASRTARVVHTLHDSGAGRECLRMEADSGAKIGFLGASASAQLSSPDLGTLATTFGLASGTPTFAAANLTGTSLPSGLVAAQSDMETATSTVLAVTPGRVKFSPNAVKGFVNFTGTGTVTINRSLNVSSITDNGTGNYTVNHSTAYSDAYSAFGFGARGQAATGAWMEGNHDAGTPESTTVQEIFTISNGGSNSDASRACVTYCGDF